ncbi:hydrogenase maturation nickel metallochaperone HypA [Azospirillum agricola]|uniref:hydrogenase maturation nickel metallochaperone HypA n=1 Tax=Azospirillum agricola TaxID=1720247 RepID=UPI000A0EF84F|nr:hydrogenase maturation nickel metallochaperone HypA [Azospirillum agricola]MBP2228512.1 hydrogenase nickel incorporation protein HypA/HybF [Azospirillum agricola]SMH33932.1 Hydrogenase-3 nickel incorporation protein HypA [Azospirillum lipoferum]
MHEMALCESLLQAMEEAGRSNGFTRVRRVRLAIGRFAGVEPEALRFGFDVVTRGTLAEGAELVILDVPGQGWCFDCSETVPLEHRLASCPRCGGDRLQPNGGTEMTIKDLEVE